MKWSFLDICVLPARCSSLCSLWLSSRCGRTLLSLCAVIEAPPLRLNCFVPHHESEIRTSTQRDCFCPSVSGSSASPPSSSLPLKPWTRAASGADSPAVIRWLLHTPQQNYRKYVWRAAGQSSLYRPDRCKFETRERERAKMSPQIPEVRRQREQSRFCPALFCCTVERREAGTVWVKGGRRYLQLRPLCAMAVWHTGTLGKEGSHPITARAIWLKAFFCSVYVGHTVAIPKPQRFTWITLGEQFEKNISVKLHF